MALHTITLHVLILWNEIDISEFRLISDADETDESLNYEKRNESIHEAIRENFYNKRSDKTS